MRFHPILASVALALALHSPAPAGAAATLTTTLPNKMTLVVQEIRTRPIVSIQVWVKAGTRNETETDRGVSAVLSKMLLEATQTRDFDVIGKELSQFGGTYGSESGYAYTLFQVTLPARSFGPGLAVLADALMHPLFNGKVLEQGAGKARGESRNILAAADRASISPARETLHAGTPLARPIAVPELELSDVTVPLAKRFYDTNYVASNMMIVVVGDVDPQDVARKVEAAFQTLPAGKPPIPPKSVEKPFTGPKSIGVPDPPDTRGTAITAAFRAPAWGTADALALDVLMAVIVESPNSRAQRRMNSAGGEFSRAASQRSFEPDGGTIALSVLTEPERVPDAEGALIALIQQARSMPVTQEELSAAVDVVSKRELYPLAEFWGIGRAMGLSALQGRPGADEVYFQRLRAIRPEDLTGVAVKYLDPKQMVLVEMMPKSAADSAGIWKDLSKRIDEKVGISDAAFKQGPKVVASTEQARAARIDAPLKDISTSPADIGRGRVARTTLPGGLKVLTSEDRSAPLVTIGIYLAGGVRYENDRNNGITSLLRESMLSSEDPAAGGMQYRHALNQLGKIVPYQDRDMWGVSLSVPTESWRAALAQAGTMFSHPQLDTITVDAARILVLTTLDKWLEDDDAQRARLIFPTKYLVSGYRLPGLGTRRNLVSIPLSDVEGWYRKFVVRGNIVVTVFGDVRAADVGPAVEQAFGDVSSQPFAPGTIAKEGDFEGFREKWELGGGPVTTVTLAFDGPPAISPDVPVMYVINSLLGGPKGWFQQYLAPETFIRSSNSVVAQAVDETPILATINIMGPIQEENAVKLLFRQFKKAAMLPLVQEDAPQLVDAKTHAVCTFLMTMSTNTTRAFQWARAEVFGLPAEYPLTLPTKIDAIGSSDLTRVGMKYFEVNEFQKRPYAIAETRPGGW